MRQCQAGHMPGSDHPVSGSAAKSDRIDQEGQDRQHNVEQSLPGSKIFLHLSNSRLILYCIVNLLDQAHLT